MKTFNIKSSLLTLLAFSFVALFTLGCGNSREDFVVTNNNTNNSNNGNLVFRFQQAAAQTIVPNGTATLRFDFFSTDPGTAQTLLFTETRPFASEVRFDNVSSQVASVAVTSFGADGLPTQTNVTPVTVVIGNDVVVEVGTGTAATFDALNGPATISLVSDGLNVAINAQTLNQVTTGKTAQLALTGTFTPGGDFGLPINATAAAFRFADNSVANISATGLVTGINFGANTTLTADYTALSTLRSADVAIQTFVFRFGKTISQLPSNESNIDFIGDIIFVNKRGVFSNVVSTPNTTYSLATPVLAGVSIDSATGNLTTGTTLGNQDIVVTYVDPDSGLTFTDTHTVQISNQTQNG